MNTTARKSRNTQPPAPTSQPRRPQVPQVGSISDIDAEIEAELEAARREITARKLTERRAREAAASAAQSGTHAVDLAAIKLMLANAGIALVPVPKAQLETEGKAQHVPENDYSDTERVQIELGALLDLLPVVRAADVVTHVRRRDGGPMSASNVRYHMRKLANRGDVHKVEERYYIAGLGWRTRDAWSKDPQQLLALLEGKKTVRS